MGMLKVVGRALIFIIYMLQCHITLEGALFCITTCPTAIHIPEESLFLQQASEFVFSSVWKYGKRWYWLGKKCLRTVMNGEINFEINSIQRIEFIPFLLLLENIKLFPVLMKKKYFQF